MQGGFFEGKIGTFKVVFEDCCRVILAEMVAQIKA